MVFSDNPIKKHEEDILNRRPLAGRIAELILAKQPEQPVVMALQGPWGAGKSSVFRLVEHALDKKAIVLWYEPWFYNNPAQMIAGYLDVVASALAKAGGKKRYGKVAKELLGKYGSLLSSIPYAPDVSGLGGVTPEALRAEIGALAKEIKQRVVVLVDDVDRLPVEEMLLVLKLVRLCSDFPYFTYLLAFDKKVVKKTLSPHFQGDSDFIEKIVQIEIPLPPVDELLLHRFVGENLAELCTDRDAAKAIEDFLHNESGAALRRIGLDEIRDKEPLFGSLREVKRYLNAVETTLHLVLPDVHLFDFFALEYVRVFQPAVHEEVYRLRYSLTATATAGRDNPSARLDRFDSIKAAATSDPRATVALRLVAEVFPLFDAIVNRTNQFYGAYHLPGWAKELRARHPGFVDRYFRLEIPPDAVSRAEIRMLFAAFTQQPQRLNVLLDEAITKYREQRRLLGFLEAVEMERTALAVHLREALATALSVRATDLTDDLGTKSIFDTSLPTLCHTLYRLVDKSEATTQQTIAQSFVSTAPDLRFAVCFFYMATPDRDYRPPLSLDFDALQTAMTTRLVATFVTKKADLIADLPHDWPLIIRIWKDPDRVTQVLIRLLDQQPEYWSKVANLAIETDFRQRRAIVFKGLARYTKLRALAVAAGRARLDRISEERELVTRFISALRVAPDVAGELREIEAVVKVFANNPMATITWTTPVWDRRSTQLEGWWKSAPWWDRLQGVYQDFSELRDQAQAMSSTVGGSEAAAEMIEQHGQLVPLATSIGERAREIVPQIEAELESLPTVPVDEGFNRDE